MKSRLTGRFAGTKTGWKFVAGFCAALALANSVAFAGPLFSFAIAAVTNINLNGNNIVVNSFDSADPNYSDWNANLGYGTYDPSDHSKWKANGNVGTGSTLTDAISIGNANIYGHVATGPGGTTYVQNYGSVGDVAWVDGGNAGIESGYASDDMNVTFPVVSLPSASYTLLPSSTTNISSSGYYQFNSSPSSLTVSAPNVTLYFPNGFALSGNGNAAGHINVNTNASVAIYVGGNVSVTGRASINNLTQNAKNLAIYALPGVTTIGLNGPGPIIGTVYAPTVSFSFGGGGNPTYDFVGELIGKSVTLNGGALFHYDENLSRNTMLPFWISTQPQNQSSPVGSNVTFIVTVGGSVATNYFWYFQQTNLLLIGVGTNYSLSLTNVQVTNSGNYSIVLHNAFGTVTSTASLVVYTDATPALSAAGVSNGQFQFNVTGVTGLEYMIQYSPDLVSWYPMTSNTAPFTVTDPAAILHPQAFYRAVFVP